MNEQARQQSTYRTMTASEFRAKCLKLMDEVAETREEIVITKNGRPVARLTPYRKKLSAPFGRDRHFSSIRAPSCGRVTGIGASGLARRL